MSASSSTLQIQTPRVFVPLLRPSRYKGIHGGRGSGKSHFYAELLVERAIEHYYKSGQGLRWACIREVQKSLAQSVKRTVEDKIEALNVGSLFRVLEKHIVTPGGGLFLFQGMQDHTAESIKSLEGFQGAWVEEAQSLSKRSLQLLRPTIRSPESELWFSWNPKKPEDAIDELLRGPNVPPDAIVVRANWSDNPWLPAELDKERRFDQEASPIEEYAHVWEGDYQSIANEIIFSRRVTVDEEFETPEDARFFFGADFGFADDPSTLIRCFHKDGDLWIDWEAFGDHVEIDHLPSLYDRVPGSRKWPIKADAARPETISYVARQGFNIAAAEKWQGSVEDGIAHLKAFRHIHIHKRCPRMKEERRLYKYKVDKFSGEVLPIVVDKHNHGWDSVRYSHDGYIQRRGVHAVWEALAS